MLTLAYADPDGRLIEDDTLYPCVRSGWDLLPAPEDTTWIPLPDGATIASLPDRMAIALDEQGEQVRLSPDAGWAVGAVLPPGYTRTLMPAYEEEEEARVLPIFGYTAVAFRKGRPVVAAVKTDPLPWWEPRQFRGRDIGGAIQKAKTDLPGNRLVTHLEKCATDYNCYTAQNTFYQRWEGSLPSSGPCNAMCVGCISEQWGEVESPQDRIGFRPSLEEVVELATWHQAGAEARIVSFGQGCEGEPLMRADLPDMVAGIRRARPGAFININTNGSRPAIVRQMVEAGLNGARVSVFSFSEDMFRAYYRPKDYGLEQVHETLEVLREGGCQVALNLLTFPGVSDDPGEIEALESAIARHRVDQVQTRSLNIDPVWLLSRLPRQTRGIGMEAMMERLKATAPGLRIGNFTLPAMPAAGNL
jgi:wyosine [tRNA(Phe)-imidazoG37] synthetase (radical SAM superfamily)